MKTIRIVKYGRERTYAIVSCHACKIEFPKRISFIKDGSKNFCSPKCRNEYSCMVYKTNKKGFKKCRKCKKEKSFSEFYPHKTSKDNLTARCKTCLCKDQRRRYPKIKLGKDYKKNKSINGRIYHIKRKYNLTENDYNDLLKKQNNVCAICKTPETRKVNGRLSPLSIDHCHQTGQVRGLLCDKCNGGLGKFGDNCEMLNSAILYLQKYLSKE